MNRARWRKWGAISGARCGPGPFEVEVDDADVAQLRGARDERVEEDGGRRRRHLDVDLVPGLDPGDGFFGRHDTHAPSLGSRDAPPDPAGWPAPAGPDRAREGRLSGAPRRSSNAGPAPRPSAGVPYLRIRSRTAAACSAPSRTRATASQPDVADRHAAGRVGEQVEGPVGARGAGRDDDGSVRVARRSRRRRAPGARSRGRVVSMRTHAAPRDEIVLHGQDGCGGPDEPAYAPPRSSRCLATNAAAWARRSRLSLDRIELT